MKKQLAISTEKHSNHPVHCSVQGQASDSGQQRVDVSELDFRLREMDRKARAGAYEKKKERLAEELEGFLQAIPGWGGA